MSGGQEIAMTRIKERKMSIVRSGYVLTGRRNFYTFTRHKNGDFVIGDHYSCSLFNSERIDHN